LQQSNDEDDDDDDNEEMDERPDVNVIRTPKAERPHENKQNDDRLEHGDSPSQSVIPCREVNARTTAIRAEMWIAIGARSDMPRP
jgi:hypothetical protein